MKRLLSLIYFLTLSPACAHQCNVPTFYDGYSYSFQGTSTVSGFIYGLDEQFLYVILTNGYINGFILIPQNVPNAFQLSANPDTYYYNQILGVLPTPPYLPGEYHETLMTESCQNLLTEDSKYIVTR